MDLSILIISHNTKQLLENCLQSVESTCNLPDFSYEIIVVDNASTDGSVEMMKKKFPNVTFIKNQTNVGFGKANNIGIRKSRGTYVLLLNSDTEVTDGAVFALFEFIKSHKDSFAGPKLINPDGSDQTSCGPFFSLPVIFAILFLKGDKIGLTRWSPTRVEKVDWVSGACLIASKKTFTDGLMFDEDIFMYMDEVDLLYRAKQKGHDVYFVPTARVMHVGSGSSVDKKKAPILNIYKGFQLFYNKHYPGWHMPILKAMLRVKAVFGYIIGTVTGKKELKNTYEEARRLVQ